LNRFIIRAQNKVKKNIKAALLFIRPGIDPVIVIEIQIEKSCSEILPFMDVSFLSDHCERQGL
jgi:hypothetical protein